MIFNPKQVDHPSFSQKLKVKHRSSRDRSPLIHKEFPCDWSLVTTCYQTVSQVEQRMTSDNQLVILDESEMNLIHPDTRSTNVNKTPEIQPRDFGTESQYPPGDRP